MHKFWGSGLNLIYFIFILLENLIFYYFHIFLIYIFLCMKVLVFCIFSFISALYFPLFVALDFRVFDVFISYIFSLVYRAPISRNHWYQLSNSKQLRELNNQDYSEVRYYFILLFVLLLAIWSTTIYSIRRNTKSYWE